MRHRGGLAPAAASRYNCAMNDRLGVAGAVLFGLGAVFQLIPQIFRQGAVLAWPGALLLVAGGACVVVAQHRAAERLGTPTLPPADPVRTSLRRICLLGAPLVLVAIEMFHPLGFTDEVPEVLSRPGFLYFGPWWFSTLHTIQTPMVGVVAAGILLLLSGLSGLWAWAARGAALVWVVYYTVLDSIQGIFLGWIIAKSLDAPAETQRFVATLTQDMYTDRVIGGVGSVVSLTGSWAFLVAAVATALALAQRRAPLWPLFALVLAGESIQISHARPYGPVGFTLVFLATLGLERWLARRPSDSISG
jgi:hypothetical protein